MDPFSQTTTVLTIDLPNEIDERLRSALRAEGKTARDVTLEALERWLEKYEASSEPATAEPESAASS